MTDDSSQSCWPVDNPQQESIPQLLHEPVNRAQEQESKQTEEAKGKKRYALDVDLDLGWVMR